jgi:hypothetical protein
MTTFAEFVYTEVFEAPEGATRILNDVTYVKIFGLLDEAWVSEERTLTNVAMYEATINAD